MGPRRYFSAALVGVLLVTTGCGTWSYGQIELGQTPGEYARVFSTDSSRQTAVGVCSLSRDGRGGVEAIVVLTTSDRRIAAKFRATSRGSGWPAAGAAYFLAGEIDAELYGTAGAGPIDTLRAVVADLTHCSGERLIVEAHSLAAAGLVRLILHSSEATDVGAPAGRLGDLLSRAPGGGVGEAEIDADGILRVEYAAPGGR